MSIHVRQMDRGTASHLGLRRLRRAGDPWDTPRGMTETAPADVLAERLVDWYHQAARPLPWRDRPTPYHVLLSELLCQQTRVETALPYFERFVARWPRIED